MVYTMVFNTCVYWPAESSIVGPRAAQGAVRNENPILHFLARLRLAFPPNFLKGFPASRGRPNPKIEDLNLVLKTLVYM